MKTKGRVLAIANFTIASRDKDSYVGESLTLCTCRQMLTSEPRHVLRDLTIPTSKFRSFHWVSCQ